MEGIFNLEDKKYTFNIKNDLLIFNVDNEQQAMRWMINAKKNSCRFEHELIGKTTDEKKVIIFTDFIKKINKKEVSISIKALFIFEKEISKVNGVSVQFNKELLSRLDNTRFTELNNRIIVNNNSIVFMSKEKIDYKEILKEIYLINDVVRFMVQCNKVVYFKIDLILDNSVIGNVMYCRGIDNYLDDTLSTKINKMLRILEPYLENIFSLMKKQQLYMAHIQTNKENTVITPGDFITIMAAFEWECRRFKVENNRSKNSLNDKQKAIDAIQSLINEKTSSKSKKHFKFYQSVIEKLDMNLSNKIEFILKKYEEYFSIISQQIYELNNVDVNLKDIALRLQKQRNNFAHGNLDKPIEPLAALDIKPLRELVYIIQLDKCGANKEDIEKCFEIAFECEVFTQKRLYDIGIKNLEDYIDNLKNKKPNDNYLY